MSPNKTNLTYILLKGPDAPASILQLSCVRNILEAKYTELY